jgi:hypothetical protein
MAVAAIRTARLTKDYCGQPLTSGLDQTGLVITLGIVVIGIAASVFVMQCRDIGA